MPLVRGNASDRTANRVVGLLASFVGIVSAVWNFNAELRARRQSAESPHWPAVSGEVTASTERYRAPGRHRGACTWAEICFRYAVGGAPHASCRATFSKSCSASTAAGLMTQFPLGAEVTVFYDPGAPAEAVLVPDSWRGQETLEFWLAVLVASGFGFVLFVWQLRRSSEADAKIGDVTGDATGDPPAAPPQV